MRHRLVQGYNGTVDAPTDEQLLQEYIDGTVGSFELLVRRHAPELHHFVLRFTGDSVVTEDVVQETFLQVHSSATAFDPKRKFKPWLFTIAANKARDHLRKLSRRREVPFDAFIGNENETGQRFLDLLSGEDVLPDEDLAMEEKRGFVRSIVEQMPARFSEVLVLAYFHRFSYKEIAEIVGIPLGTVKSRLHAAIVFFAERYREAVAEKAKGGH
jgi:RNA polymerase sigma-70 factor (ECF subfamily)